MTPPTLAWAEAHIATTRAVLDCLGTCVRPGRYGPEPRCTTHVYSHCSDTDSGEYGPIEVWFTCLACHTPRRYGTISRSVRWNQSRTSRKRFRTLKRFRASV